MQPAWVYTIQTQQAKSPKIDPNLRVCLSLDMHKEYVVVLGGFPWHFKKFLGSPSLKFGGKGQRFWDTKQQSQ